MSTYNPALRGAFAVTPHASNPLPQGVADALFVGGAGTVILRTPNNGADVTVTMPAGQYFWCRVSHVRTGGTASGIVALYS